MHTSSAAVRSSPHPLERERVDREHIQARGVDRDVLTRPLGDQRPETLARRALRAAPALRRQTKQARRREHLIDDPVERLPRATAAQAARRSRAPAGSRPGRGTASCAHPTHSASSSASARIAARSRSSIAGPGRRPRRAPVNQRATPLALAARGASGEASLTEQPSSAAFASSRSRERRLRPGSKRRPRLPRQRAPGIPGAIAKPRLVQMPKQLRRLAQLRVAQRPGIQQHRPEPPLLVARRRGGSLRDRRQHEADRLAARGEARAPPRRRPSVTVIASPSITSRPPTPNGQRRLHHAATRDRAHTTLSSPIGSDRSTSASPAHNKCISTGRASAGSRASASSSQIVLDPPPAPTASARARRQDPAGGSRNPASHRTFDQQLPIGLRQHPIAEAASAHASPVART